MNVRRIRNERGLSQTELSKRTGIAQSTISEIESGQRVPQARTLLKLANTLEVSIDELLADPKPRVLDRAENLVDTLTEMSPRIAAIKLPWLGVFAAQEYANLALDGVDMLAATREGVPPYWRSLEVSLTRRLIRLCHRFQDLAERRLRERERQEKAEHDPEAEYLIRQAQDLEARVLGA